MNCYLTNGREGRKFIKIKKFFFAMTSFEKQFFYHSLACNQNEDKKAINRRVSHQNSSIVMIKKKFLQEMDHKSFNSTQRNSL